MCHNALHPAPWCHHEWTHLIHFLHPLSLSLSLSLLALSSTVRLSPHESALTHSHIVSHIHVQATHTLTNDSNDSISHASYLSPVRLLHFSLVTVMSSSFCLPLDVALALSL